MLHPREAQLRGAGHDVEQAGEARTHHQSFYGRQVLEQIKEVFVEDQREHKVELEGEERDQG